jgi:hypothetical protein
MHEHIKKLFSSFSSSLIDDIEKNAVIQEFKAGDVIMRTGQYIKNTVLVLSVKLKYIEKTMMAVNFLCTICNQVKLAQFR